jgi:hypothetical protein
MIGVDHPNFVMKSLDFRNLKSSKISEIEQKKCPCGLTLTLTAVEKQKMDSFSVHLHQDNRKKSKSHCSDGRNTNSGEVGKNAQIGSANRRYGRGTQKIESRSTGL